MRTFSVLAFVGSVLLFGLAMAGCDGGDAGSDLSASQMDAGVSDASND